MRIDAIAVGINPPEDVNVIIEVPIGGEPIKYEMDKAAGTLVVDRFLHTPMRYPGNYGFVPHTLSEDGDPIDVLVANTRPIVPGAVINVRPIGVLKMEDDAGGDEKILAVPVPKLTKRYEHVLNYTDLPQDHARAGAALLRALQGPGARQVGEDARLGRRRRSQAHDPRRHRAGEDVSPRDPWHEPRPGADRCPGSRHARRGDDRARVRLLAGREVIRERWLAPGRRLGGALIAEPMTRTWRPQAPHRRGAAPRADRRQPRAGRRRAIAASSCWSPTWSSTIIEQECLDELADYVGLRPQIAAITERAMRGELEFEAALKERVGLLKGLRRGRARQIYAAARDADAGRPDAGRHHAGQRRLLRAGLGRLPLLHARRSRRASASTPSRPTAWRSPTAESPARWPSRSSAARPSSPPSSGWRVSAASSRPRRWRWATAPTTSP